MTTQTKTVNKLTDLQYWFMAYKADHMTEGNIKTHYFGVPTVTVSLLGLLDYWIQIPMAGAALGGGALLLAIAYCWFLLLDKKLALLILPALAVVYYTATLMSLKALVATQIIGWIFQLLGHYKYEGRSPAFFKSLPQLLIGPFFIFAKAINYDWNKRNN